MKKIIFTFLIFFLIIYSIFFPEITVNAARNGIQTWFHQILPALLPFTILSSILVKSNFLNSFKGNANLMAVILTTSCGFVFGFPIGAKLSADFYKQGLLTKSQASLLAIATNNFSPVYVCGFALSLLFASKEYNSITYLFLYLIPLGILTIYLLIITKKHISEPISPETNISHKKPTSTFHLDMQVMDAGIISGFESLIKICGYIVLFSIITELLINTLASISFVSSFPLTLLIGNLEISNGISLLSECEIAISWKYIATIQLLSFGGVSGIAQTSSILSDAKLSVPKYIIGKAILSLLLTLLSVIYVFFSHLH
jgi:hypothetical protein